MMKYILAVCIVLISTISVNAQIHDPVKWSTSVEKVSETEYVLVATATIDMGWHLYSQTVPEGGPIATNFSFKSNTNYLKRGNTKEGKGHTVQDKIFNMQIKYFSDKAVFKQRIKPIGNTPFKITGTVEFMVCNDTSCLPPKEVDLSFSVK